MKSVKISLILTVLLITNISVFSQKNTTTISGTITNADSKIIEYATVFVKNSNFGSSTDEDGKFSFLIADGTQTLVISALGYKPLEKTIVVKRGQNNVFNVVMTSESTTLNEVLVTGKTATQKINESAYNVVALDAKQLYNSTLDLSHALDRISGVRVRESGGVGSSYNFSLNGFSGRQIKFFIDGIPMENFGSSFQINNIPINLAERVEVYKGVVPISLGADALGGAINIVTSSRKGTYIDASYSYGSFNTHRSYINAGYTAKSGFTVQVNAFQNYSDNDYKVITNVIAPNGKIKEGVKAKRFHDNYHNETLIANVGVVGKTFADKLLFGITLGRNRADIQNGAKMKEYVFGNRFRRGSTLMPSLKYLKSDLFTKGLDVSLTGNSNLGYEQTIDTVAVRYNWLGEVIENKPKPGSEMSRTMYKYKNNTGIVTANVNYKLSEQHAFTINHVYNTFNRKGSDELYPNNESYKQPRRTTKNVLGIGYKFDYNTSWNTSVFVKQFLQKTTAFQTQQGPGGWGTTEYTKTASNHDVLGYGFASTLFVTDKLQLKASFEKSVRMPGNEELFGNEGENLEANMALKPESSRNFNLGATFTTHINGDHGLIIDGGFLLRDSRDFIMGRVVTNGNKIEMINHAKVLNHGFNTEVRYSYKNFLTAGVNMTYQNIRDNTKYPIDKDIISSTYKNRLPNLPYLFGNGDCSVFINDVFGKGNKIALGYNVLYVNEYYLYWPADGQSNTKHNIPTQISQDVNLTYTLNNGMYNLALECRNVFDENLYDNFSLQKPGRSFSIKFRYFFNKQ